MKRLLRVMPILGVVVAASLLAAACAPVVTAPPPTSPPTAVPATATAVPPTAVPTPAIDGVGTDINVVLPPGDVARGRALASSNEVDTPTCQECHTVTGDDGPGPSFQTDLKNDQPIATRAETRYLADDYTGDATSAQQYLIESIVLPDADIIESIAFNEHAPGVSNMGHHYGERLTAQDLADVIAYLETFK